MRNRTMLIVLVVVGMALAACGGDAGSTTTEAAVTTTAAATTAAPTTTEAGDTTTTAAEEPTTTTEAAVEMMDLSIGLFPSLDYAAFYVGLGDGIFEEHGLNVDVEHIFTGTGLFSSITSGQKHLATNSLTSGTVGITNNLPIQAISVAAYQETEGNTEVLVLGDSDIQSFGDLAGRTVATINLQGLFHLGVMNAVTAEGGDPSTIEALPMSPADEPTALAAGRVDAIVLQDPFLTQAKTEFPEFRTLGNPFATFDFQLPVGVFWSSKETADANPELMRRFREALAESTEVANANPERLLEVIPEYTDLTPEQLGQITLPAYSTDLEEDALLSMQQIMLGYGWLTYIPSYNQIVWSDPEA
jgi:NitT/TauT family transport system substrate-binding protein